MITNSVSDNYSHYLSFLRQLVNLPSVFTKPESVKTALLFCKGIFEKNLDEYSVFFDKENNLIALPKNINLQENITYLSAHIDTVDANISDWDTPFHPWKLYEDEKEIVARGVSDCKAGVAYQLFLSFLLKNDLLKLENVGFMITFKEEGSGKKTSVEMAKNMGKELPVSQKSNYLFVLENTVQVADKSTLCIYTSERGNYVIKITDDILKLQQYVKKLTNWNPVCILPKGKTDTIDWLIKRQNGGHACSVKRSDNLLTQVILEAQANSLIQAGEVQNFATIPTNIRVSSANNSKKHILILSNRSFDSLSEIHNQLKDIEYEQVKDFAISEGLNIEEKFLKNNISSIINNYEDDNLNLEYTYNIGASDASIIYNSLDKSYRKNFYPIVLGPGTRSQRKLNPQRLTHGKNETFDKETGKQVIIFISELLKKLNHIQ
ncbi:M20/M25/M40 family metallo-hydrolase [Labilibaculum sp.]|uniref:M20/M25/M40 family metallo-hydrolase n=1 Tax=Labilibaculum sp. TaxID=2060723 RepID=UPI0035623FEF